MLRKAVFVAGIMLLPSLLSGCGGKSIEDEDTVEIEVSKLIPVADPQTGRIVYQLVKEIEYASRSLVDKGAVSSIPPQRIAVTGKNQINSFSLGFRDKIVASVMNKEGLEGSDLWVFDKGKVRLTTTSYHNIFPSFSGDGKYVYFSSTKGNSRRGSAYIWRMSSTGSGGITRIGTGAFQYESPLESPDGEYLLSSSIEYYGASEFIWYQTKSGGLATQLRPGTHASWWGNNKVLFAAPDENTGMYSIWTVGTDGSQLTQLISDNNFHCIEPTVDPTGQFIAYTKQDKEKGEGSRDIYVYSVRTGLSQQMTTNVSRDDNPEWSQNGKEIYFRSTRGSNDDEAQWSVWRLSAEGI